MLTPRHRLLLAAAVTLWLSLALTTSPNPTVDAASSASRRGAELFATSGCAHCHGPNGVNGTIGPDLQKVRDRLSASAIHDQIYGGGQGMPAFGGSLNSGQIADLVAYLRTRRKAFIPPPPPAPAPTPPTDPN